MKNLECSNCVIASSQNSNSFLERFDRMNPLRRRRNFKPMKLQNSLVGTKAFIKDSLRQCGRLVKAFGTKLVGEAKLVAEISLIWIYSSTEQRYFIFVSIKSLFLLFQPLKQCNSAR